MLLVAAAPCARDRLVVGVVSGEVGGAVIEGGRGVGGRERDHAPPSLRVGAVGTVRVIVGGAVPIVGVGDLVRGRQSSHSIGPPSLLHMLPLLLPTMPRPLLGGAMHLVAGRG